MNHRNLCVWGAENQHVTQSNLKGTHWTYMFLVPYEAHRSSSVPFCKILCQRLFFFLDILMEWFSLRMQKVSNIPFPWGWGSASLPLCSSEVPSIYIARYGLDSVQDWPASGIVASRSPRRCDFLWECVKLHGCCTASSLQPGGQTASAMGVWTWCVTEDPNKMGHSNDVCLETKKVYTEHL